MRKNAEKDGDAKRAMVVDVWARRAFGPPNKNPFLHHNLHLVFSQGFPKHSYLSVPNAAAFLERFDAMPLGGIHDLQVNVIYKTGKLDALVLEALNSPHAQKVSWFVSEPNGLLVSLEPDQATWRKFALAIDFSRTDEELIVGFADFLKATRGKKEYDLPSLAKCVRASHGGVSTWLTERYAKESLYSLAAHRLIKTFNDNVDAAISFSQSHQHKFLPSTRKEFLRTARRVPSVIKKLFGESVEG